MLASDPGTCDLWRDAETECDMQQTPTVPTTHLPQTLPAHETRKPGIELEMDWVRAVQANSSAIERRAASLGTRRSVKQDYQAAWLLKAIRC